MSKKITKFRPRIRSRHPSHECFRSKKGVAPLGYLPFRSVIRFGSTSIVEKGLVELNSIQAVKNSSSKLLMKQKFSENNVLSARWFTTKGDGILYENGEIALNKENTPFPLIGKKIFGSRGNGIVLIKNMEELNNYISKKGYYFEKYYNFAREYRLHVSKNGCFYTCRKMLKSDTPEELKFFRNDINCVWYLEDNPAFNKPSNWDEIVSECIKALNAVGLDFGACDVRVSTGKNDNNKHDFIIVEINSAPSMGDITELKYKEELPKLLIEKYNASVNNN